MSGGVRFAIALGSNLGDSRAILADAVERLAALPGVAVDAVSALYRTAPVGGVVQDDFLNAVAVGRTTLPAEALLAACHAIEAAHRRTREVRWGPRTLDLDLLALGDERRDDPALTLPHPRAHERAFVLLPWLDADPDAVLPGRGRVADLAAGIASDGVRRLDGAWTPRARHA